MDLSPSDRTLLARVARGLPLTRRPFFDIARELGRTEDEVLTRLHALRQVGAIKRFGLVVRHHELGYDSNAMVVWDIADDLVDTLGRRMAELPYVTLCYRRRRAPPRWPYNLFVMIHGQSREIVQGQIDDMTARLGLQTAPRAVLFSRRRFKQRGAAYDATPRGTAAQPEATWTISTASS